MADNQHQEVQSPAPPEDLLDRLIRKAQEEVPNTPTDTPTSPPVSTDAQASTPVGNGVLGGLLSNPAMLSALPKLMNSLGPLLGSGGQKTQDLPTGGSTSQGSHSASNTSIPVDRHTALLCAIKPYLGKERQQAAEQMINLCRVLSTLQGMGISLPMLMSAFGGGRDDSQHKEV